LPIELSLLIWSVPLGLAQCLVTGFAMIAARGLLFTASARDDQRPVSGIAGRIIRANANFMETYVFFAALVLAGAFLHRHSPLTVLGAQLYFWSRILYWPLYVGGVPWIRSLVWAASFAGLLMLFSGIV
jgi:uncharacterized MAPEG superfamily protein